jgi:pyruvate dehydrogenase E2 component (dihydrolipoamide acetyltransferase)
VATETVIDVVMPQMGVSVSEGTVTRWLKQIGDPIAADETLLEISTDKVDTEIPSPGSGVVQQILVQEGETVEVGTKLATIAPEGTEIAVEPEEDAPSAAEPEAAPVVPPPAPPPVPVPGAAAAVPPAESRSLTAESNGKTFVSPVVARIASEHGVDVASVHGTGRGGRVTKKDILDFIESRGQETAAPPQAPAQSAPITPQAPAPTTAAQRAPEPVAAGDPQLGETFAPMTPMRKGIAEHMRRSLDTSAHVTSAIEVDMSKVVGIRAKLKKEFQAAYGVNPTYLAFIARATVDALREYPWINGELRGDKIVTRSYVNLGIAVELADGKGLIVPVLKNVEALNLIGVTKAIADIAARSRAKQLLPDDVQGGTFTITNPGGYGTFHGTPVISQPQAAILGTYAVVKRAWVIQDELGQDVIAIRPIMNMTLTYDHRLVDGALAGRFLRSLRQRLETWDESAY